MNYEKQCWNTFDESLSMEENALRGGIITTEKINHIESGIEMVDVNLSEHKIDAKNPHKVTADQVGLGNIKNYGLATVTEAVAGIANDKYMTPYLVSESIKNIKESFIKSQLSKITADNGESYLKVSDTEKILDRVISTGAGFRNGEATGKTSDSPTGSNVRLIINMVVTTAGSVIAQDTSGNVYSRIISGSVWRGDWQQLVSKSSFDELASRVTALEGKVK